MKHSLLLLFSYSVSVLDGKSRTGIKAEKVRANDSASPEDLGAAWGVGMAKLDEKDEV